AIFHVLHPAPLVGMGQQRLAQKMESVGENGQLAHLGHSECTVDADEIAEVELLRQSPAGFTNLFLSEHHLDFSRPIPNVDKMRSALAATLQDSSRGPHARRRRRVMRQSADGPDRLMSVKAGAPRIHAEGCNAAELVRTTRFKIFRWRRHDEA